jgi:phage baseplate assembly protein gpV
VNSGGPKRAPLDPQLCGIYYAIVCQNKDEEGKVARVKVRFPWLPGGDQDQAHWALLAVLMEGDKFGTYTVPEIDDTVMVVFLHGDIRRPVVIGGMWNKTDTPPEKNENGKNDFRFIKSRSGHRFLLDDSSKVKVVITDKDNKNYVGCGEFAKGGDGPNAFEMAAPTAINGSATKGVAVCSLEGKLNLWCPKGTLTIDAQHVELTGSDKIGIKAGKDMALEGGMSGKVVASQEAKLEGSKVSIN